MRPATQGWNLWEMNLQNRSAYFFALETVYVGSLSPYCQVQSILWLDYLRIAGPQLCINYQTFSGAAAAAPDSPFLSNLFGLGVLDSPFSFNSCFLILQVDTLFYIILWYDKNTCKYGIISRMICLKYLQNFYLSPCIYLCVNFLLFSLIKFYYIYFCLYLLFCFTTLRQLEPDI